MTYSLAYRATSLLVRSRRFLLLPHVLVAVASLLPVLPVHAQASSSAFTFRQFAAQVFAYEPPQRAGVTAAKFAYAKRILAKTKTGAHQDTTQLNAADYWNITSAFVALHESKSAIEISFTRAVAFDASAVCSYLHALGTNGLDNLIPETVLPFYQTCLQAPAASRRPSPHSWTHS